MKVIIYTPKTADEDKKHKTHKHKTQKSHGSFVYTQPRSICPKKFD
jgi:hypothetical protein